MTERRSRRAWQEAAQTAVGTWAPTPRWQRVTQVAWASLMLAVAAEGSPPPTALAPGAATAFAADTAECPLLRWQSARADADQELVVYTVGEARGGNESDLELAFRTGVSAATRAYRLPAGSCLVPGRRYAWSVRVLSEVGSTWAEPLLFEVAADGRDLPERRDLAADAIGALGAESAAGGVTFGIHGLSASTQAGSTGLVGESTSASGETYGLIARTASPEGVALRLESTAGGKMLRGIASGVEVFSVDPNSVVTANAFVGNATALFTYSDLDCSACVDGSEIAAGSIGNSRLVAGSVRGPELADGAVGAAEIAAGVVTTAKIAPGAVTTAKLAADTVGAVDLAPGAVLSEHFQAGSVRRAKLADEAVTLDKIEGTERLFYVRLDACEYPERLTTETTCVTRACDFMPSQYFDCATNLCQAAPLVCNTIPVGKVLAPEIQP